MSAWQPRTELIGTSQAVYHYGMTSYKQCADCGHGEQYHAQGVCHFPAGGPSAPACGPCPPEPESETP